MSTRRRFLGHTALLGAAATVTPQAMLPALEAPALPPILPHADAPERAAQDEQYWANIAARYRVQPEGTINLEAGYFGQMAEPVLAAHRAHTERANGSYFARREYAPYATKARDAVAAFIGAAPAEVALTRGATEALQALIGQYNRLRAGDTVLYADLDYNAMQWAMNALAARCGATVATLELPEPATRQSLLDAYAAALAKHPRTRLLLLTHGNNKTGLFLPVREIVEMAHARGADVVVDAAHAFGQIPLTVGDLGADFVGINLHKWVGAPVGAGALYIRADKLERIDRAHADESAPLTSINSRVHTGTVNFATVMTIPDALAFQASIGAAPRAARLRYLRTRWMDAVRDVPAIQLLTPTVEGLSGAIGAFRVHGNGDRAANQRVATTLHDEFHILVFPRTGLARGDCVRATPALYSSAAHMDALAQALRAIVARG
jgi:selenocysteine lyase/cysteine desulfurase